MPPPSRPFLLFCKPPATLKCTHCFTRSVSRISPLRASSTSPASKHIPPPRSNNSSRRFSTSSRIVASAALGLGIAYLSLGETRAEERALHIDNEDSGFIRLKEIHQHDRDADTHWVYRGDRVYDITEWVPNHPGGDVIMRALGGSIDPYWNIFSIHQKQDVNDILEQYFIGKIDPRDLVDGKPPVSEIDDLFKADPARDPNLVVLTSTPFNAETPQEDLNEFITPTKTFYVRHHLWVPEVEEADDYRLEIELPDGEEVSYSLADLRRKFEQHTITATLQCSGNRRRHMTEGARQTKGLQWKTGAISNAEWTGVKLRDVLVDAGFDVSKIPKDVKHAQFTGLEAYGASIPIEKACDPYGDVLLVHQMNGKELSRDHGYPLRILVPGVVAARSVKWLKKISLAEEESTSQWQRRDYKCFGPNEGDQQADWDAAPAIQETPVQSAITSLRRTQSKIHKATDPASAKNLQDESVIVEGYAFSGGGRKIIRVDISPDDGKTWQQASLTPHDRKGTRNWSWQHWSLAIPVHQLKGNCCVKAVDCGYNTQPQTYEATYNFRGNLTNAWHRVPVDDLSRASSHGDGVVELK